MPLRKLPKLEFGPQLNAWPLTPTMPFRSSKRLLYQFQRVLSSSGALNLFFQQETKLLQIARVGLEFAQNLGFIWADATILPTVKRMGNQDGKILCIINATTTTNFSQDAVKGVLLLGYL